MGGAVCGHLSSACPSMVEGYNILEDENGALSQHMVVVDLQDGANTPDQQEDPSKLSASGGAQLNSTQSSVPTVRHVRDFSTSSNWTVDTQNTVDTDASDCDFGGRGVDTDSDDCMKKESKRTIWESLRNPKVYGTIIAV